MTLEFKLYLVLPVKVKLKVNHKKAVEATIMGQLTTEQRVFVVTQFTLIPNVTAVQNEAKTL